LINAILRRASREDAYLTKAAEAQPIAIRYSTPEFLIDRWARQFGVEASLALCQWNNRPAPNYLRINQLRITPEKFLERYPGSFLLPRRTNFASLTNPTAATEKGDGYIQDPSTAIACEMLQPGPGDSVLDACAAPGGKTAYLAEMMRNEGLLVAADADEIRLQRLRENLLRLGVSNVHLVHCNWLDETSICSAALKEHSFDHILVDAPCTNTGVIRRRVDVRWRLRPDDFVRMPRQQFSILRAVRRFLKPGGSLVYSTCSLESEENEGVVTSFLRVEPDFRLTIRAESLPFRDQFDGAFAARLHQGPAVE
jgi:16S rRNA (cytosine967-C5)-methyltransferase